MRTVEKSIRLRHFDLNAQVYSLSRRGSKTFAESLALIWPESKLSVLVRAQNSIYWGRGPYPQIALFYKYLHHLWEEQKGQKLLYMKNVGRVYGGTEVATQ